MPDKFSKKIDLFCRTAYMREGVEPKPEKIKKDLKWQIKEIEKYQYNIMELKFGKENIDQGYHEMYSKIKNGHLPAWED